jgi:hypothetical protein
MGSRGSDQERLACIKQNDRGRGKAANMAIPAAEGFKYSQELDLAASS